MSFGLTSLLIAMILPSLSRRGGGDHDLPRCAGNLRQIGASLVIYHSEFGSFPSSLANEHLWAGMTWHVFQCPLHGLTPFTLQDLQAHPEWLADPTYVAYTYVPPVSDQPAADEIVAFETIDHPTHRGGGANVLFADGRVRRLSTAQMKRLRTDHANGVRPLKLESGDQAQ